MTQKYVIAYDLGTSGVKAAVVNLNGRFIADATKDYPLYTPYPGWAEQDPELYWKGVCEVTRRVLEKSGCRPEDARGIAFGTQWKGIIPIDAEGRVLHNSIIWLDNRAEKQAKKLNAYFGKDMFCSADYWPKLWWFRENCPDLYERAEIIFEANSFLKWKATGAAMVDITNHFIRSYDERLQAFYDEYLKVTDMKIEKFPPIGKPEDLTGNLTAKAAEELGLIPGVPVFAGCGDIPAITIGSGSTGIYSMHAYFGSSGWIGLSRPHSSDDIYLCPFDEKKDILIYGMQAIGLSLNWSIRQLYHKEFEEMGGAVYDFINADLAGIGPGSEGVLATPWMYGERPPNFSEVARGNFLNLNSCHDRRHMIKAIMEGVCYTLKMNVSGYWEETGKRPAYISAVGGGSCSDVWMQAFSDILNLPVHVPENPRHAGAVGTAYCALIGLGLCESFEGAAAQIRIERSFYPNPDAVKVYEEGYNVFRKLYLLLEPVFKKMNLQNE